MLGEADITVVEGTEDGVANALKRGELHVHMNGAVPASTIREILADEGTSLPEGFDFQRDMVRLTHCRSLADYLRPWQILRLFPKKRANLDRMTLSVFGSLAENQVDFVELRSSLLYLATLQGCSPAQALERLIESTGEAGRATHLCRGLPDQQSAHGRGAAKRSPSAPRVPALRRALCHLLGQPSDPPARPCR